MTMQEWGVVWQAFGALAAVVFGGVGLCKIYHELRRLNEQREKDAADLIIAQRHKRTDFFLQQHRRLFDDADLSKILSLIDGDDIKLVDHENWDRKRKFLVFFEEIELLCKAGQFNRDVAVYMFGYYATAARDGQNFWVGIDKAERNWKLFYEFCEASKQFLSSETRSFPREL